MVKLEYHVRSGELYGSRDTGREARRQGKSVRENTVSFLRVFSVAPKLAWEGLE